MALCNADNQGLEDWLVLDEDKPLHDQVAALTLDNEDGKTHLPLEARRISAVLDCVAGVAEVTEQLTFASPVDCSANFTFPVPGKAAVVR